MTPTMTQVIGQNVKARREAAGMTAKQLGEELGKLFPKVKDGKTVVKPWPTSAIYMMEAGDRSMIADEVLALASILETTPAQLVTPPIEVRAVQLGATTFDRSIFTLGSVNSPAEDALSGFEDDLTYIWSRAGEAWLGLKDVRDMLSMLQEQIRGYRQTGEAPAGVVRKLEEKSAELQAKLDRYQSLEGEDDGEGK